MLLSSLSSSYIILACTKHFFSFFLVYINCSPFVFCHQDNVTNLPDKNIIKFENLFGEISSRNVLPSEGTLLNELPNENDCVLMDVEKDVNHHENDNSICYNDKNNEIQIKNENINKDNINDITRINIESKTVIHDTIMVSTLPLVVSTINKSLANGAIKRAETKRKTLQSMVDANIRFERHRKYFSLGLGMDGGELSISSLSRIASMAAVFIHATGEIFKQ